MTGNCTDKPKNYYPQALLNRAPKQTDYGISVTLQKSAGKNTHAALLVGLGRAAALRTPPLRLLASLRNNLCEIKTPKPPLGLLSDYGCFITTCINLETSIQSANLRQSKTPA